MRQSKTTKQTQEHILNLVSLFIKDYLLDMPKPVQKFIRQMLFGIIRSRSVIVQRIAVSLSESITLKKCCDRLYRHLSKHTVLHEQLMDAQISKVSSSIREDSGIMIDLSDINKSGASKMQGLDRVWDGSESQANQGYFTIQASVCHYTNPKSVLLLSSELFSLKVEGVSENDKIIGLIHSVIVNTDNRGIFIMDRGMDRCQIIKDLIENDVSFIIRGNERHLTYQGKGLSYREIAQRIELPWTVESKNRTFSVGMAPVQFTMSNDETCKHQRKKKEDLYLVVGKEHGHGFVYYLCRFRRKYSNEEMASLVVKYYGLRWSIEEVHRQVKQDFNWEDMQLLNYWSLKNMNALLWMAASFIYNEVSKHTEYFIKKFPNRLIYRNEAKEKSHNMIYRLLSLISEIFASICPQRILTKRRRYQCKKYYEADQLCLNFEGL